MVCVDQTLARRLLSPTIFKSVAIKLMCFLLPRFPNSANFQLDISVRNQIVISYQSDQDDVACKLLKSTQNVELRVSENLLSCRQLPSAKPEKRYLARRPKKHVTNRKVCCLGRPCVSQVSSRKVKCGNCGEMLPKWPQLCKDPTIIPGTWNHIRKNVVH
jgi:hypothetical protein